MAKGQKTGRRRKGTPNKITAALKDMILEALDQAHPEGSIAYLKEQAKENPVAFMTLVGKVLPLQVTGSDGQPLTINVVRYVDTGVPRADDSVVPNSGPSPSHLH